MNILVTGANGQLAKTIKRHFENNNDGINFYFKSKEELDISSENQVFTTFKNHNFNYCINCAAYTKVDLAEKETIKAEQINSLGPKNLANACKQNQVCLIHISTDYVFNGKSKTPYLESNSTNPVSQYGTTKRNGEKHIQLILKNHFIIRTAWLYSSYQNNFLNFVLQKATKNEPLTIVNTQKGTPTSCDELSRFIYHILKNKIKQYGVYHFSCEGETTWYGFAQEIISYFPNYNQKLLSPVANFPSLAKRPDYSVLSLKKANKIYPFIKSWKNALQEVLKQIDTLHL